MFTDFPQEDVQFLLKEFSNQNSSNFQLEKTDDESKHSSNKSVVKADTHPSSPALKFFDFFTQKVSTKSDFILAIIEIGHSPEDYFKKFPLPSKKYFWYFITQKNPTTKIYFQKYFDKFNPTPPSKIREIFSKLENINNFPNIVEVINEFKSEINQNSFK